MQSILKLLTLSGVCLITSCHHAAPMDYAYLTSHPAALQDAVNQCKMTDFAGMDCATVRRAANDFSELMNEEEQNPVAFGKKILEAQTQLVDLQNKAQSPTTEQARQQQQEKIDAMLAVVSTHSPE
jgi:hypothetical protein